MESNKTIVISQKTHSALKAFTKAQRMKLSGTAEEAIVEYLTRHGGEKFLHNLLHSVIHKQSTEPGKITNKLTDAG